MKKTFKAFTLVEMLIVMGIIIILMAVGIASGRAALRNANKIEHQNAAEQIYQAMQGYYADNREYPAEDTPAALLAADGDLDEYVDEFDGGSEATYAYLVDAIQQEFLVCVTIGGAGDVAHLGIYCTGNGLSSDVISGTPGVKFSEYVASPTDYDDVRVSFIDANAIDWDSDGDWGATRTDIAAVE
ncbi:type II secretion system GspH family protein [bacterium]|nr:type II secretion system GspH family protein [bacterium]